MCAKNCQALRGQLLNHHTVTWTKKIGEGPQFVKNRTQKWLFFAKKLPRYRAAPWQPEHEKKNLGRHHNLQKIIPENAYFSQYEPLNLIGHGNGEGGKKLLDHHNEPKENWGAPQFVKKSYPKMAIFQLEHSKKNWGGTTICKKFYPKMPIFRKMNLQNKI